MPLSADGDWPSPLLWLVRTLSFFNTVCLLWLGLTVLLNVERRRLGTWLAGGGLLLGALFFAGHSSLVGREPGTYDAEITLLWPLVWLLLIGAPYLWLLVMGWYTGQLRAGPTGLWILTLGTAGFAALAAALLLAPPLSAAQALGTAPLTGTVGLSLYGYLVYSLLCVGLSLLVLRNPGASDRLMGHIAQRRARPWLVAASLALLSVSLSTTVFATWFLNSRGGREAGVTNGLDGMLWFDAVVSGQVALAVVLMGQAIGSYELFTGRVLPRRGLLRHWRRTLILGAGYGAVVAAGLALPVHPVYQALLSMFIIILFHALVSWRLFVERDHSMAQFRPFVSGQRLYERLLEPSSQAFDIAAPFRTLCEDMLRTEYGCLVPLGMMAQLVTQPLVHPPGAQAPAAPLLTAGWKTEPICYPLEAGRYGSAQWAAPLWSHRGLIGALLFGPKKDGGLYTHEEIEVARATAERLMDELATTELSRRLVRLQRHRLAERQVVDQRTRRVLHDDVLPLLQTAILELNSAGSGGKAGRAEATALLANIHQQIAALVRELPSPFSGEIARWGVLEALRREVTGELGDAFQEVTWTFDEQAQRESKELPSLLSEVLFAAAREVARNAARHGRADDSQRPLRLRVTATWKDGPEITLADDGVGIKPGSSAQNGQGMALYSTMLAVIGGTLTAEEAPEGTRIVVWVPATLPE